jgi:hypothetical protein
MAMAGGRSSEFLCLSVVALECWRMTIEERACRLCRVRSWKEGRRISGERWLIGDSSKEKTS